KIRDDFLVADGGSSVFIEDSMPRTKSSSGSRDSRAYLIFRDALLLAGSLQGPIKNPVRVSLRSSRYYHRPGPSGVFQAFSLAPSGSAASPASGSDISPPQSWLQHADAS